MIDMNQKGAKLMVTNNSKQHRVKDSNKEGRKQMLQKFRERQDQSGPESILRKNLVEKVGIALDFKVQGLAKITLWKNKTKLN